MMKLKELKEMNISQLASLAEKSRLQLIEFRFSHEFKDTSMVRKTKRLIARCMTLINEKKSTEVSS